MEKALLTILRNKLTTQKEFRNATRKLAYILTNKVSKYLEFKKYPIKTQWTSTQGTALKKEPVIVVILRAGLALLPPFLDIFEEAPVGFVGLKRDEITAQPYLYYKNLPKIQKSDKVIILDPTIATGGSGLAAIELLIDQGIQEKNIIFAAILAAKEGLARIQKEYPVINFITIDVDPKLNSKKFIVPGFGDFGDRYFGTE